MSGRILRAVKRLGRWYLTPSGLVYALATGAIVLVTVAGHPVLGFVAITAVVGLAVPLKMAQLEAGRRELLDRTNEHAKQLAHLDKRLRAVEPRMRQVAQTAAGQKAQAARRDAVAALDTARHEWSQLLRAERRRVESQLASLDARIEALNGERTTPGLRSAATHE